MLVALVEPFVVGSYGWLTPRQLLDRIALTQAVPGALLATVGICLPSFT